MKKIFSVIFVASSSYIFAQTNLRENTQVSFRATETIHEKFYKTKAPVSFEVAEDVLVKGKVVIAKGTPATAEAGLTLDRKGRPAKGNLRVDIKEVKAVDGTTVKLNDCWIAATADQRHPKVDGKKVAKGAAVIKNTKKNCSTSGKYEINVN